MAKHIIAKLLLVLVTVGSVAALDNDLLIRSDLKYVGAFIVTSTTQTEGKTGFGSGRISISLDETSFFLTGLDTLNGNTGITIAEFPIPTIVNSTNLGDLNSTGAPLQAYSSFYNRIAYQTTENTRQIANMKIINGRMFVTTFDPYLAGGVDAMENLFVVETPDDLANSAVTGYITIQNNNAANGWLSPIPASLQSAMGGDWLIGNARRDSVNSRWSMGPSAFSLNSVDLLAAGNSDIVNTIQLLKYPIETRMWWHLPGVNNWNYNGGHFFTDPNCPSWKAGTEPSTSPQNKNWKPECVQNNDLWTEVSRAHYGFIVPNTNTYLTLGRIGGVRKGIAYKIFPINGGPQPSSGEHPFDYTDWDNYIWMFDVQDLIDHKNGITASYDAMPYEYGSITLPFQNLGSDGLSYRINSADYVESSNRLYISLVRGGEESPIILIYEIIHDRPMPPASVTSSTTMTWTAPTLRVDGSALSNLVGYEIKSVCGREVDGNIYTFQTTNTNYTLPTIHASCKNSVAAYDADGKYSEFVWNGATPSTRKFAPATGGMR